MRSLSGQKQQRKQLLCTIVGSYLETSTRWGRFYARPSQVRAAAKRMVDAGRIPMAVATALNDGIITSQEGAHGVSNT
jgi:hypothetical protein